MKLAKNTQYNCYDKANSGSYRTKENCTDCC